MWGTSSLLLPSIHFYNGIVGSAPILAVDTPGFCDSRSDRSNDPKYVALIKRLVGEIDLFMFITKLDDSRVEGSELDTLKLISDSFSKDLWKRTIVGLTRADRIPRGKYKFHLDGSFSGYTECSTGGCGGRGGPYPVCGY